MIELSERGIRILLVDDEPSRASLAVRLRRQESRYSVTHLLTAEEASQAVRDETFDVVLCDYGLADGATARPLVDQIVSSGKRTKAVVFSGYEEGDAKEELLKAGAFWYLSKPLVFEELLHTIRTIESFQREQEMRTMSAKLAQISYKFHTSLDLDQIAEMAVEAAIELGFGRSRLYLVDRDKSCLVGKACRGMGNETDFVGFEIPLVGSSLIEQIFKHNKPSAWDTQHATSLGIKPTDREWISAVGLDTVPWLDTPLLVGEERIGTLAVDCNGIPDPSLTPLQRDAVGVLGGLVGQAIHNCRLFGAVARNRASLLKLLDDAPDALITTTLDGTIDFVSPSTRSILGLSEDELIGKRASEVYTDAEGSANSGPEIASRVMGHLRRGEAVRNFRTHVRAEDRKPLAINLSAALLHDPEGREVGTIGFLKLLDIESQRFEEYQNLLEGFGYGTAVLAPDLTISYVNRKAERLIGRPRAEVIGRPLTAFVRAQDVPDLKKAAEQVSQTEGEQRLNVEAIPPKGAGIPLEIHLTTILQNNRKRGFAVGLYDRREQVRLIWAGHLAMLGEMVGPLAHEIRNPLSTIQAAVDSLLARSDALPAESSARRNLERARRGVSRIEELVLRLKRLSRRDEVKPYHLNTTAFLRDFVEFISHRLDSSGFEVEVTIPDDLPMILGDPVQLEQVLNNLVRNAEEAVESQPRKHIWIAAERVSEQAVEITVEDSGPGVPEQLRENIFEPFFTTKIKQGTGFGLSISRHIAREHRGELLVQDGTNGSGARFVLELPVGLSTSAEGARRRTTDAT